MLITIENYFLLFFFCAVLGWCMEVTCKLIQFHRFINRGFLLGPYCPIYGFGAVLITALLSGYARDPVAVFLLSMVLCGTLEYLTSYAMEKLFHARWWDYSQKKFNLNGRVCANTLIPFGLLGLVMVYMLKPLLFNWLAGFSQTALNILCGCLLGLLLTDVVVSTTVLGKIRKTANLSGEDDTEAITKSVREALAQQSRLARRLLRAFPHMKLYNRRLLDDMKARKKAMDQEMAAKRAELRGEIDRREKELNDRLRVQKAEMKVKKAEAKAKMKKGRQA